MAIANLSPIPVNPAILSIRVRRSFAITNGLARLAAATLSANNNLGGRGGADGYSSRASLSPRMTVRRLPLFDVAKREGVPPIVHSPPAVIGAMSAFFFLCMLLVVHKIVSRLPNAGIIYIHYAGPWLPSGAFITLLRGPCVKKGIMSNHVPASIL